jgi:sugar/nucleoside kinase (ribokinase family)
VARRLGGLAVVGPVARDCVDGGPPRIGGPVYYGARALAALGEDALVVTKYAEADEALAAPLHRIGLHVVRRPAGTTAAFTIENRGDRRVMALDDPGEPWSADDLADLAGVAWVQAGAVSRSDFPPATLALLARGRTVLLDGQGLTRTSAPGPVGLDADYDPDLLRHVRILKLSLEEAEALGLDLGDRALGSLGVPEVVVTLGSRGSVVYADGVAEHVPAHPLALSDPTGAGDVFAAAYLAARRRGHGPLSAARRATTVVASVLG